MFSARHQEGQAQTFLLIALALTIVGLFVLATLVVNAYGQMQARLGTEWYDRGVSDLRSGNAEKAVIDLRTALSYSREASYRLELARALVAANRVPEAREYLLSLWERQPGSAELNLELARVSATSQAIPAAIGYFEAAVYGAWDSNPDLNRRNTRLELARFLLKNNDKQRALPVLGALASDLPPDPELRTEVGTMLLQAGDAAAARQQFESALHLKRNYAPAISGAGAAAYASNDFTAAQRYLETYLRGNPNDATAKTMLEVVRTAMNIDPLRPRLSSPERRARVLRLFSDAEERVNACIAKIGSPLPPPDVEAVVTKLASQSGNASERQLRDNPDLVDDLFVTASDAMLTASKWCGVQHPTDDAIAALAHLHGVRP